jgi:hypothetical protein
MVSCGRAVASRSRVDISPPGPAARFGVDRGGDGTGGAGGRGGPPGRRAGRGRDGRDGPARHAATFGLAAEPRAPVPKAQGTPGVRRAPHGPEASRRCRGAGQSARARHAADRLAPPPRSAAARVGRGRRGPAAGPAPVAGAGRKALAGLRPNPAPRAPSIPPRGRHRRRGRHSDPGGRGRSRRLQRQRLAGLRQPGDGRPCRRVRGLLRPLQGRIRLRRRAGRGGPGGRRGRPHRGHARGAPPLRAPRRGERDRPAAEDGRRPATPAPGRAAETKAASSIRCAMIASPEEEQGRS